MKSPNEGQNAGRNAEGNHVSQRIQLPAKIAAGIGQARNASVQSVKWDGKQDGDGRQIEMRLRIAGSGLDRLRNRKEPGPDVD